MKVRIWPGLIFPPPTPHHPSHSTPHTLRSPIFKKMPCWRDFSKMPRDHSLYLVGLSVPHTCLASFWKDARNSIPTGFPVQKPQECSFSWYGNCATIWRHLENYSLGDKYFSPLQWFKIDRVSPKNYAFLSPRWRTLLGKPPQGSDLCS